MRSEAALRLCCTWPQHRVAAQMCPLQSLGRALATRGLLAEPGSKVAVSHTSQGYMPVEEGRCPAIWQGSGLGNA